MRSMGTVMRPQIQQDYFVQLTALPPPLAKPFSLAP